MAQDHSFKVYDGLGKVVLVTDSWNEAANCQYRNNELQSRVGYEPNFTLWIVDNDIVETKIQSQL